MRIRKRQGGFTLIELLVVIGIIALLATIGMSALPGLMKSNAVASGNRQLLDDINMARNHALNERTTVYMVFVPPLATFNVTTLTNPAGQADQTLRRQFTNRIKGQFVAYNFVTKRSPGDQPGLGRARYLSEWKQLPEGVYIKTEKFAPYEIGKWSQMTLPMEDRPMPRVEVPFPSSRGPLTYLPAIAFNYRGQLIGPDKDESAPRRGDEFLTLTLGSIVYPKGNNGQWLLDMPETIETPKGNSANNPYIRIDWLTGRARIEEPKTL